MSSVTEYHDYLTDLAAFHDASTCTTPGHVVIEWNGQLWCGPGGYWPELQEGLVLLKKDPQPLRGTFVRANPKR